MRLTPLKELRMRAGLTLAQVAERMDSSVTTVSRFENGQVPRGNGPSPDYVKRYARAIRKTLRAVDEAVRSTYGHAKKVA